MIEQSDTAFRILTRRYGANLCYTPMIHAHTFVKKAQYRDKMFHFSHRPEDRPLIAQIAGSNQDMLLECAKLIEPYVDAIDLNLGCPTQTAKRGRYGAFLLGSGQYVVTIVQHLVDNLSIPVTCKVRLLPLSRRDTATDGKVDGDWNDSASKSQLRVKFDLDASLHLYQALIDAGASMLTIHGRTRNMKGRDVGVADWDAIREVVKRLESQVPILANGNLSCYHDVLHCLEYTGTDGVMSSEAILEYPPGLFLEPASNECRPGQGRLAIAREYLELAKQYDPERGNGGTEMQCMKMHMQAFLYGEWCHDNNGNCMDGHAASVQSSILTAKSINDMFAILGQVELRQRQIHHKIENESLSWYYRHWESPPK
jgi:tRNA-dihydrouridine synthase 1